MKRLCVAAMAAWASLGALPSLAQAEFQYFVFPVQSITGLSQSATGAQGPGPKYSGMINEKYADLFFDAPAQQSLLQSFREEVRKRFPQAVVGANQVRSVRSNKYAYQPFEEAQCNPSFTVNYKDAFGVAIGVSRLSAYVNRYGNYVDALIPVTYTLRFIKLNGADVVFTRSETIYTRATTLASDFFAPNGQDPSRATVEKLKGAVQADGQAMVARLVEAASKGFAPKQSTISVTGRDGNYIIFGNGSEVGFASNQDFEAYDDKGRELSYTVVYATNGLAVAVASDFEATKRLSNGVRVGDKLSFTFSKKGQDDAKPTLFATQYQPGPDGRLSDRQVMSNALMNIVTDDIGFNAPFNIVKHDADFTRLKEQIRADANCESTIFREMPGFANITTVKRAPPDYYLKLDTFSSPAFTAWGTGRVNSSTIFANAVALSVVDRTGVISQSFLGSSPYTLERNAGRGLSQEEATEVNLKNAALAGLPAMVSGFTNTARTVGIRAVANGTATLAQPLPANVIRQARLVRPLRANDKQILMPLPGELAQIVPPSQDGDRVEVRGEVKPSDLLIISGVDFSRKPVVRCDSSRRTRFLPPNLTRPSNADEAIAHHIMARAKGYNLMESEAAYIDSVERSLRDGLFDGTAMARSAPADAACYVVVEQQQLPKNECTGDKCTGTASVASAVRVYVGEAKVAESIHGARFDYKDIAPDALSDFIGVKAYENHMGALPIHRSKLH